MGLVVDVDKIVVVLVDLGRRKLALVDNVPVAERAKVEPVVETNHMGGALAEHVELALEVAGVVLLRPSFLGLLSRAVDVLENDKRLQNDGLTRLGRRSEEGGVFRHLSPAQDSQLELVRNILECVQSALEHLLLRLEEDVSHGVLAEWRQLEALLTLEVLLEELVRDRGHDACAITVSCIGTDRTSVGHVAKQASCCGGSVSLVNS